MGIRLDMNYNVDIVAADIGNSRIKLSFGLENDRNEVEVLEINTKWKANFIKYIENALSYSNKKIELVYCSSNPAIENEILEIGLSLDLQVLNVRELLLEKSSIKFEHIEGIGTDRVLGLDYLARIFKPPFITIDCGTALTINVLDSEYNCIGGAILPGIYTQFKSLNNSTSSLPEIMIGEGNKKLFIGKNTNDAIRVGVINGISGGVINIIEGIERNELKMKANHIFITGGYAQELSISLQKWNNYLSLQDNLILKAIKRLFQEYVH